MPTENPCLSVGHYENFPVASALLPRRLRTAVVAIYRFARAADDIADEGDATAGTRLAELAGYARELDAIERGEMPADPLVVALAGAVREHQLPLAPLRDLLSAFTQDVSVARYASFDALLDYCRRSANPVGRLLLALYDRDDDANRKASDAICTGLQLANFWQDVAVDWRKGRVYVPLDDLDRFGVTESQIASGRRDERWSRLMRFETMRTRSFFTPGRHLVRNLPWRAGIELAAIIAGGTRILERIDAVDGDVFGHRPALGVRDWMIVAGRALVPRRKGIVPTS